MSYNLANKNERGEVMTLVVISLVAALLFALGWIFWQNFIHKEEVVKETDVIVVEKKNSTAKEESATPKDLSGDANKDYLVLESWKVRFKIPSELKDAGISFRKQSSSNESSEAYSFNTDRVKKLGNSCDKNSFYSGGFYSVASISRSTDSLAGADALVVNDDRPIKGYHYVVSATGMSCIDQAGQLASEEILGADAKAMREMLMTVEPL